MAGIEWEQIEGLLGVTVLAGKSKNCQLPDSR